MDYGGVHRLPSQCVLARLDSAAAKQCSRILRFLGRVSKEIYFEFSSQPDALRGKVLMFRAANPGRSAACQFWLGSSFFESFGLDEDNIQGWCAAKSLGAVCKALEKVDSAEISVLSDSLLFSCSTGGELAVHKEFCVRYADTPPRKFTFKRQAGDHVVSLEASLLSRCLSSIPESSDLVLSLDPDGLFIKTTDAKHGCVADQAVSTSLRLSSSDFDNIKFGEGPSPSCLSIEVKDLRLFLALVAGEGWKFHMFPRGPGDPVFIWSSQSEEEENIDLVSGGGVSAAMLLASASNAEDKQNFETISDIEAKQSRSNTNTARQHGTIDREQDIVLPNDDSDTEIGATPPRK
uniref:Cell cycle checkpoint control protein RAD9A n=1 Tax=Palpitomonas bilix TaxID=652834 RepID=A0A7S3G0L1_9EUKA|mmetsp:Transcript_16015/g.40467  ORF Transcript_16015/g.40467 Transcript_16015/m.40467 type:complete len:349 (+) Transcript_16015:423-1469(+)